MTELERLASQVDLKGLLSQDDACLVSVASVKRALENEPQKMGRWIPVSERLPEKAFGCLVTVEEDDIYGEPHRVIYPDFVGYDGTWNDADGEVIPFDVIAWIPLPEPYVPEINVGKMAESEDGE